MERAANTGVAADDWSVFDDILREHPDVETAVLYGSRATGRHRPGSDIDVVLSGKKLTDRTVLDIRAALRDSNLPYLFDVVSGDGITDERLKQEIQKTGKLLYSKQ